MRVLITSLSAGSGHVKAAEAVLDALHRTTPDVDAVHVDVADFVSPSFRKIYVDGYRMAVNHTPALWGRFYRYWDLPAEQRALTPYLHRAQRACATAFYAFLHNYRPDVILTTHFLIPQLLEADNHSVRCVRPRIETVITDYDVHSFWVSSAVSRYYVGHESMIPALTRHGISSNRIQASGIPVHPHFSDPVDAPALFKSLGLDAQRPVILMLSGGLGLNELYRGVEKVLTCRKNIQIITVSGKNQALRARLERIVPPAGITLLNLGYVQNMPDLLSVSDLVITKPGGLTVSECLTKMKPMILFSPIPGQEEKNAEFLLSQGAALQVSDLNELPVQLHRFLDDPSIRAGLLRNIRQCARPRASYVIAESLTRVAKMAA